MLKVLDLFAGLGGFSLGLERTGGFQTVAFCEIEEYPRRVLRKHWPEVPIYEDVRELTGDRLAADGIAVDVITGGFPCQDVSTAGPGHGLDGERSGLYAHVIRLARETGARLVLLENVAALLSRGLGRVLRDLAALGLDAEWHCIPSCAVGGSQRRERVWIVAHPPGLGGEGLLTRGSLGSARQRRASGETDLQSVSATPFERGDCHPEPLLRGLACRLPRRVERVTAAGNSVDPHIPELIGHAILEAPWNT